MKCEIGECIKVLTLKQWNKTVINNQLKSERWWQNRLKILREEYKKKLPIEFKNNTNPGIYNQDGSPAPVPIPFEIEIGMPDLNYEIFYKMVENYQKKHPNPKIQIRKFMPD